MNCALEMYIINRLNNENQIEFRQQCSIQELLETNKFKMKTFFVW